MKIKYTAIDKKWGKSGYDKKPFICDCNYGHWANYYNRIEIRKHKWYDRFIWRWSLRNA